MARIGIFGGTFDPVHFGHLILAERCRDRAQLDQVIFVPAHQSPLKDHRPAISDAQRIELLKLATAGHEGFSISVFELEKSTPSFTVDTLKHFRNEFADDELFFLLGSDSLIQFGQWKSPVEICELAQLLVIERPGQQPDLESLGKVLSQDQIDSIQKHTIESPLIEISSTDIRKRIQTGQSFRFLMPRANEMLIKSQKLYQKTGSQGS